ncbi:MAG: hypothetical protein HYX32_03440 [Actinobacteria bacterium]|nr:hypothetical protein [Actinomycetota bacterium]
MNRKLAFYAATASMLLILGACSSGQTNTTTQASQTSSPAATAKSETASTKAATDTTSKSTGTTASKSTGTTSKSGKGFQGEFTPEQDQCITEALSADLELAQLVAGNSSGQLTAEQAGAIGALIVGCVPKTDLVTGLTDNLKNSDLGQDLSTSELQCVKEQILALDSGDLAVFVGILIFAGQTGDKSIIAPQISKLNSACGTKMAA